MEERFVDFVGVEVEGGDAGWGKVGGDVGCEDFGGPI